MQGISAFVPAVEMGSFTAAAERIRLSKPTAAKALRGSN
ncbi:helix-turn-helix domain-containing protein [Burkholderia sp. TSV86]